MAATIMYGNEAVACTQQAPHPQTVECNKCNAPARIAFGLLETGTTDNTSIHQLHNNRPGGFWVHDNTGVAVYFCTECSAATCLYNQA